MGDGPEIQSRSHVSPVDIFGRSETSPTGLTSNLSHGQDDSMGDFLGIFGDISSGPLNGQAQVSQQVQQTAPAIPPSVQSTTLQSSSFLFDNNAQGRANLEDPFASFLDGMNFDEVGVIFMLVLTIRLHCNYGPQDVWRCRLLRLWTLFNLCPTFFVRILPHNQSQSHHNRLHILPLVNLHLPPYHLTMRNC